MNYILISAVSMLATFLYTAIFIRVILSWIRPRTYNKLYYDVERAVETLTEPILAPIRRLVPPVGPGIDFSPLVALILIGLIRRLLVQLLLGY